MALEMLVDGVNISTSLGFDVTSADERRAAPARQWATARSVLRAKQVLLSTSPRYEQRELVVSGRLKAVDAATYITNRDELLARLADAGDVFVTFSDDTSRGYDVRFVGSDARATTMSSLSRDALTLRFLMLDPFVRDAALTTVAFNATAEVLDLGTAPVEDAVIRVHGPFTNPSIKLRHAGLFHLEDGAEIEPSGATFTRASTATFTDAAGRVRTAASGAVRKFHYVDDEDSERTQARKLEASRTNNLTQSEAFDHADWTASNVTVSADADTDPEGGSTADNLSDTSGSAHGFVSQAVTVADDSLDDAASVFLEKKSSDHVAMVGLEFTGGTTALTYEVEVNLNGGATDVTNSADAPTRVTVEDYEGFHRVTVVGANNTTGNTTATMKVYPHVGTTLGTRDNTVQGDADAWGAQHEDGGFSSSYTATTTAAVTRSADDLSYDISGTPLATPQEMTVYVKFVERGTAALGSLGALYQIGDRPDPRLLVLNEYKVFHDNGSSTVTSDPALVPKIGDKVEHRVTLTGDGKVQAGIVVNGGAETTGSQSGPNALPGAWLNDTLWLNAADGTATGLNDLISLKIASGVRTMDEMRALDDASSDILFQTDFTLSMSEGEFLELDMGDGTIEDEAGNSHQADRDSGTDFPWALDPVRGEQQSGDFPLIEVSSGQGELLYWKKWQ